MIALGPMTSWRLCDVCKVWFGIKGLGKVLGMKNYNKGMYEG